MKNKTSNYRPLVYLGISFGWTWICWIGGYYLSTSGGQELLLDANIFQTLKLIINGNSFFPQLLFTLGVYGPAIGFLILSKAKKKFFSLKKSKFLSLAIIIPIVIVIPTALMSAVFLENAITTNFKEVFLMTIPIYFLSNFLTSGTEEMGWRGYLFHYFREKEKSFWDVSWKGGLIWAAWHYPLMFFMYREQGIFVLIPTVIGFTAGIVAMNYIINFVYEKTQSIPVAMGMHALNNTMSFIVLLFFPSTPLIIITHVAAWMVVGYLEKKHKLT